MSDITVMFSIPETTLDALRLLAEEEHCDVGTIVRGALDRDFYRRSHAKTAQGTDERLVGPLRTLLARDLAEAQSWTDLRDRLAAKGYRFQEAGAGLALHRIADDSRVALASELGASYGALMRRFAEPFPGHSHQYLVNTLLSDPKSR